VVGVPTEANAPQQRPRRSRPRADASVREQYTPIIAVVDCDLGIRRRFYEIGVLIGTGVILLFLSPIVISSSGPYLESGIGKIASTSLYSFVLFPLKLSWDRFLEANVLKDVRNILSKNQPLSKFMEDEIARIGKKRMKIL
jgi:hypothetical protein